MNQIETFFDTMAERPHPRCRLRHGDIGKLPAAVRPSPNRSYRYSGPNDRYRTALHRLRKTFILN